MSDLYPFANNFLELNGLQYHYLDEGQGDPVVMGGAFALGLALQLEAGPVDPHAGHGH